MVRFNTKKGSLNSSLSVEQQQKLTKTEQDILLLLTDDDFPLNIKQIAQKRNITQRAVQKTVKKIKEKGYLNLANQKVRFFQSTYELSEQSGKNRIRLHGQEWNIRILQKDEKYNKIRNEGNTIKIDQNTVRLYEDSIEIYSVKSFFADDPQKATSRSLEYWDRFFARLESDLKVILVKNRANNIKLVNSHYSEINNELGQEAEKKGYKIRVYATEDGKLWFLIDNSFNLHEAEGVHPRTSKEDMTEVQNYFNDIRDKDHFKPSEITLILGELTKDIQEQTELFKSNAELTRTQLIAVYEGLKAMSNSIQSITEIIKSQEEDKEPKPPETFQPKGIRPYYVG